MSRASSLGGFWQGSQTVWFALWLLCRDELEGTESGIGKTIRRLLESRQEMSVAGTRARAQRWREAARFGIRFRLSDRRGKRGVKADSSVRAWGKFSGWSKRQRELNLGEKTRVRL